MTLRTLLLVAVTAGAFVPPATAAQPPSIASVLDSLDRLRAFHETAISPDGRRVAWVEDVSIADLTTAIYVRGLRTGEQRRVTAATDGRAHKESRVAWSADNHTLVARELRQDDGENRGGGNRQNRTDQPPQRAADEQGDQDGDQADA